MLSVYSSIHYPQFLASFASVATSPLEANNKYQVLFMGQMGTNYFASIRVYWIWAADKVGMPKLGILY